MAGCRRSLPMLKMFINTKIKVNNSFYFFDNKIFTKLKFSSRLEMYASYAALVVKENFSKVIIEADVKKVIHHIRWENK